MNKAPRTVHICVLSLTPEQARDIRARALAFVFDCYAKKKAAPESRPNAEERFKNDSSAGLSIHNE